MNPFGVKRPWGAKVVIMKQLIMAEGDCMLQFLKKIKAFTKLVPEPVH